MKRLLTALLLVPILAFAQSQTQQHTEADKQAQALSKLKWQEGPAKGLIGANASIQVPKDYVFLDAANTRKFLEINGNPPQDKSYTIAPSTLDWFAIFQFEDTGYIKDDEKLDPDDLLKQIKKSDISGNEERKRLNIPAIYTEGWQSPPHYDPETNRLEWGIQLRSAGTKFVNYTSRILGRTGVMTVILVADSDTLEQDTKDFKQALTHFSYNPGQTYAEFKQGDKLAEYGLAALILGGAAAVATKKGFWAVIAGAIAAFWKLIAGVVIAAFVGLGAFFKKKK